MTYRNGIRPGHQSPALLEHNDAVTVEVFSRKHPSPTNPFPQSFPCRLTEAMFIRDTVLELIGPAFVHSFVG